MTISVFTIRQAMMALNMEMLRARRRPNSYRFSWILGTHPKRGTSDPEYLRPGTSERRRLRKVRS